MFYSMWAKISAPKINPRCSSAALDVMAVVFVKCPISFFFFRAKLSNRTVRMGRFYSALFSVVAPNHKGPWLVRLRS